MKIKAYLYLNKKSFCCVFAATQNQSDSNQIRCGNLRDPSRHCGGVIWRKNDDPTPRHAPDCSRITHRVIKLTYGWRRWSSHMKLRLIARWFVRGWVCESVIERGRSLLIQRRRPRRTMARRTEKILRFYQDKFHYRSIKWTGEDFRPFWSTERLTVPRWLEYLTCHWVGSTFSTQRRYGALTLCLLLLKHGIQC